MSAPRVGKTQRQHRIAEVLASSAVTSQSELVAALGAQGIVATQATVSRDLQELGAIKVRGPGGKSVYAVPELPFATPGGVEHLRRLLTDWVVEVGVSDNLVVVRTPPGSAHVVGAALDRGVIDGVLGNVAGDDTVLVVAVPGTTGARIADDIRRHAGLDRASHAT